MANKELAIGQVGACAFPSFTGVGEQDIRGPRILFVEPPELDDGSALIHSCHYEKCLNSPTKKGYIKAGQSVVTLDIYHPETPTIPLPKETLGFLGLENVVNDPFYNREKNIFGMFALLNQIIAPGA